MLIQENLYSMRRPLQIKWQYVHQSKVLAKVVDERRYINFLWL